MSGEGATSGLIGKLSPLPLSVLHNPPNIRSVIRSCNPRLLCFLSKLFLPALVAQSDGFLIDGDKRKRNGQFGQDA